MSEEVQTSDILDKHFKTTLLKTLEELKEVMWKHSKMIYEQNEDINKIQIIKQNQNNF